MKGNLLDYRVGFCPHALLLSTEICFSMADEYARYFLVFKVKLTHLFGIVLIYPLYRMVSDVLVAGIHIKSIFHRN